MNININRKGPGEQFNHSVMTKAGRPEIGADGFGWGQRQRQRSFMNDK